MPATYLALFTFFFLLLVPDFLAAFFFFALLAVCFLARFVVGEAFLGLPAFLGLAAFLASTTFLALSAFAGLALLFFLPAETFFGLAFSEPSSAGFSCSTGCFSIGAATTASTIGTGAGSGATGAADASPSALHSRSACASRGETSGYSGSSPTVGRIFQERAHLMPTAFSTTTATPGASFSPNASDGASSLVTIAFDVMQTSARSISNSVSKIFLSET